MFAIWRFAIIVLLASTAVSANARDASGVARPKLMDTNGHPCAMPVWPAGALERGARGTVTLLFKIDTEGEVSDARLQKSSGDADLDEAARAALVKCHYSVANHNGTPASYWLPVQFVWTPPKPE
jgi:bla regulator protein BlaR1